MDSTSAITTAIIEGKKPEENDIAEKGVAKITSLEKVAEKETTERQYNYIELLPTYPLVVKLLEPL